MPLVANRATARTTTTSAFGNVPSDRIKTVTVEEVLVHKREMDQILSAADSDRWKELDFDEDFLQKCDHLRAETGALWLKLWHDLDEDIAKAQVATGSLAKCMWSSLIRRQFSPQKYYPICGTPGASFGCCVSLLGNLPARDVLMSRWNQDSWKGHLDRVWRTKGQLMEKEKEYRELAMAIAQIGTGLGGMLIGLAGLGLSLIPLLLAAL